MITLDIKYKDTLKEIIDYYYDYYKLLPDENIDRQTHFASIKAIKSQLSKAKSKIEIKAINENFFKEIISGFENEDFISEKKTYQELLNEFTN